MKKGWIRLTAIAVFMIMAAMVRPQIAKADSTMDQLERTYAGTTVVDGAYDNDTIMNAMNLAIQGYEEQLVIYRPKEDVLRSDYYKFHVNSDFAYFWVDGWSWKMHEDYAVVTFRYCGDAATIDRMQKEVYEVLDDIYYTVKDWDSEWRVAQYVYNYLIREVTYDHSFSGKNIRNIYGAMVEKSAVCAGYAVAFDFIMSRLGYPVGVAGNDDHVWNYMEWNSPECFLDATWGDPDTKDRYKNHYIDFSYFSMDADELAAMDDHRIDYVYISDRGFDRCDITSQFDSWGRDTTDYCDVQGYYAGTYSAEAVQNIFKKQIRENDNSLIVSFSSRSELDKAVKALTAKNCKKLNRVLKKAGYRGAYQYHWNDATKTLVVYINMK